MRLFILPFLSIAGFALAQTAIFDSHPDENCKERPEHGFTEEEGGDCYPISGKSIFVAFRLSEKCKIHTYAVDNCKGQPTGNYSLTEEDECITADHRSVYVVCNPSERTHHDEL